MNLRPALASLLVALLAVSLVGIQGSALAYNGDRVGKASSSLTGFTAKNYNTHVWTTIVGTYKYYRVIRHNGTKHRVAFRGITVSAQRCKKTGCWGAPKEGRLWSPVQLGSRPRSAARATRSEAGALLDFCLNPAGTLCAAPWNWSINDPVNHSLTTVRTSLIDPCANGAFAGFGVEVARTVAGAIFAEDGVLAVGERSSGILGPEGYAVGSMAGCFVGIGVHGVTSIRKIAASLDPLNRS